jgi:hypothetical protein
MSASFPSYKPGPSSKLGSPKSAPAVMVDTHQKIVTVYDKEGRSHKVQRHAANDLVNHCGWSWGPDAPKESSAPASQGEGEVPSPSVEPDGEGDGLTDDAPDAPPPPSELDVLRAKYKEVTNTDADSRWGKKRLAEEIEKLEKAPA